jgi:hypothetical protein
MGAKVTWMALFERTWETNDYVRVAYKTLASDIGTTRRQVIRYVQTLVEAKLIQVQHRHRKGGQEVNQFTFIWHDLEWIRGGDNLDTPGCKSCHLRRVTVQSLPKG